MVTLRIRDHRVELQAPYYPTLPSRSRQLGGRWLGMEIGWVFPLQSEQGVRSLCEEIWAMDGTPVPPDQRVALRITVEEHAPQRHVFVGIEQPIYLIGREIAGAVKNRKAARPGRGVQFLQDRPRCIVTPSTWWTTIPNGAVFLLHDVPRAAVARLSTAVGRAGRVELVATDV
jgi:hypothetical protein